MTKKSLLTIAMPTLNRGALALASVKALLETGLSKEQVEIVVLNNGSTLGLEEYREIAAITDPRITYIHRESTQSFGNQFFQLLSLVEGEYFMFLSDEEQLDREAFLALVPRLRSGEYDYFSGRNALRVKFESPMTVDIMKTALLRENRDVFSALEAMEGNFIREHYPHNAFGFCYCALLGDFQRVCPIPDVPILRQLGSPDALGYSNYFGLSGSRRPASLELSGEPMHLLSKIRYYLPERRLDFLEGWLSIFTAFCVKGAGGLCCERDWLITQCKNLLSNFYERLAFCCLSFCEEYDTPAVTHYFEEMRAIWQKFAQETGLLETLGEFIDQCHQKTVAEYEYTLAKTESRFLKLLPKLEAHTGPIAFFNCSGQPVIALLRLFQREGITIDYFFDDAKANIYHVPQEESSLIYPVDSALLAEIPADTLILNTSQKQSLLQKTRAVIARYDGFSVEEPLAGIFNWLLLQRSLAGLDSARGVVLYGCGEQGRYYTDLFLETGIRVLGWCDKSGKTENLFESTLEQPAAPEALLALPEGSIILVTPRDHLLRGQIASRLEGMKKGFVVRMLD